ncbi:MAG: DNA polymerase [Phycisphaerales bacterium]
MSLKHLFVDLNAYFASVEQQLQPWLRGKPVAVAPLHGPSACCIAVSYEAKRLGVKTGMTVGEASLICPGLEVTPARPEEYVRFHHAILSAVDTVLPVDRVFSIDEFSCRLMRGEREPAQAERVAMKVKGAIRSQVGERLTCSVGVAPNRFLAKVATDMMKPDGLVILQKHELPAKLYPLALIDLAGIGPKMNARLNAQGVHTVEQLCARDEREMQALWSSILGQRWYHWLRGEELDEFPTKKRSIGHQHVLGPEHRDPALARGVAMRLLHKAAARARHLGYLPQAMTLRVHLEEPREYWNGRGPAKRPTTWGGWGAMSWHQTVHLPGGVGDTLTLVDHLASLWARSPAMTGPADQTRPPGPERVDGYPVRRRDDAGNRSAGRGGAPGVRGARVKFVDVTLHDLLAVKAATMPLFEQERHRVALAKAMDEVNRKHGKNTVYAASMHEARNAAKGGIAFSSVPDPTLIDSVENRMR